MADFKVGDKVTVMGARDFTYGVYPIGFTEVTRTMKTFVETADGGKWRLRDGSRWNRTRERFRSPEHIRSFEPEHEVKRAKILAAKRFETAVSRLDKNRRLLKDDEVFATAIADMVEAKLAEIEGGA